MDIKSAVKTDRLYWLGRYTERVYSTLRLFEKRYDIMIEENNYDEFCTSLEIPNVYESPKDFLRNYPFDLENENSIASNLKRAYDNAIELREEIGSEALAYVQLAVYEMNKAGESASPLMEFQTVVDYILALWGCIDDQIEDLNTRSIIKVGKRVERIDLYGRLKVEKLSLVREVKRLTSRVDRCNIHYSRDVIKNLNILVAQDNLDYHAIVTEVEKILEE